MPSVHRSCTTCTSCSQKKSCSFVAHSPHLCAARAAPQQPAASLSLPLCHSRLLVLVHSASRAARSCASCCGCFTGEQSRSGRISMHPAGLLGRCVFGGAGLTVFSCGKHKHTVGQSVLVVQTHTNRLSHFSFLLPANFLHFSFFLPANFLHLLFSFLLTFCFLQPTIYCLFTSFTYMFNTFATTTWLFVATLFN